MKDEFTSVYLNFKPLNKYIAIDISGVKNGTNGIAINIKNNKILLCKYKVGNVSFSHFIVNFLAYIENLLKRFEITSLIIENFIIYPNKANILSYKQDKMSQLIGAIKYRMNKINIDLILLRPTNHKILNNNYLKRNVSVSCDKDWITNITSPKKWVWHNSQHEKDALKMLIFQAKSDIYTKWKEENE